MDSSLNPCKWPRKTFLDRCQWDTATQRHSMHNKWHQPMVLSHQVSNRRGGIYHEIWKDFASSESVSATISHKKLWSIFGIPITIFSHFEISTRRLLLKNTVWLVLKNAYLYHHFALKVSITP
jgi:hypothetical protein